MARLAAADRIEKLRAFLEALEAAPCDCPFARIPCQCDEYARTGDCRHPPRYPDPCVHVQAAWHTLPLDRWTEHCQRLPEYQEPPLEPVPPEPIPLLSKAARVSEYELRFGPGPLGRYALRHPQDIYDDEVVATEARNHPKNGAALYDGPLVFARAQEERKAA